MIFKARRTEFTMPEAVEPSTLSVVIASRGDPRKDPSSYYMALYRVQIEEFMQKDRVVGVPTMYCYQPFTNQILLWPEPDNDMHGKIRYCPAMKEI